MSNFSGNFFVVDLLESAWITNCCAVAAGCLIFYDYFATLPHEARLIWGRRFSIVTLLFYLNRLASLGFATATFLDENLGPLTEEVPLLQTLSNCIGLNNLSKAMEATLYALWAAFSAMRVYAIGNNSWMLAVLAGLFGMVPFATSVYQSFPTQVSGIEALPGVGSWCLEFSDMSQTEQMNLTIAARVCGITSDAIVLVETWRKTYSIKRDAMRHNIRTPLATMLMRDGTLYFVFILSLNVLDTIGKAFNIFDYTPTFMIPSFSIIISRFLLNLRQLGSEPYGNGASDTSGRDSGQSQSAGLRFASFIDNMGEDLDDESGSSDLAIAWDSPQSNAVDEEPQDSAVLTQGSSYPSAEQEMADIECNVHSRIPSYNEGTTNMCIVRREQ